MTAIKIPCRPRYRHRYAIASQCHQQDIDDHGNGRDDDAVHEISGILRKGEEFGEVLEDEFMRPEGRLRRDQLTVGLEGAGEYKVEGNKDDQ